MTAAINLPMESWLEISQSIERIELAKRSLTNRLIHAAAHIRLHEEEQMLGNLCFRRQANPSQMYGCAELFKIQADGQLTKVPIAGFELPENIISFREIEIRLGIF